MGQTFNSKYILIATLVFIISSSFTLPAQVSLLNLQNERMSYKQVLKKAKQDRKPILAVLYSPTYPVDSANEFENIESIIAGYNVHTIVIDWVMAPHRSPQGDFTGVKNPSWMFIHPDDIIISVHNGLSNDAEFSKFLETAQTLSQKVENAIVQKNKSKDPTKLLELAKISTETYDKTYSSECLEDYLKRADTKRINNKLLRDILVVGYNAPFSKRLNRLILNDKDRAIMVTSLDTILTLQSIYILNDLKKKALLEPFYVWDRYEKELGYDADSLFRIFAIGYFSTPPVEVELLYAEAFDYLAFYPRSPWEFLDKLYSIVIPVTTIKEDLETLNDLISFQIFREESYRQLDYKAVLLYKLGEKERALHMIDAINRNALDKGIRYRSMLNDLTKEE